MISYPAVGEPWRYTSNGKEAIFKKLKLTNDSNPLPPALVWSSLPLKTLHVLYESTLNFHYTDVGSPEHRLQGNFLDISSNKLFKAVRVCDSIETKNRPFLKIKFANKGIDALNLIKNPPKVIFLHTLNIRSRHAFLKAIHVRLLPKFSTTKQVCSKSTSKVSLRIPHLIPALALSFFMLHVAI